MTSEYSEEQIKAAKERYGAPMGVAVMKMLDTLRDASASGWYIGALSVASDLTEEERGIWSDLAGLLQTETASHYATNILNDFGELMAPDIKLWGYPWEQKKQYLVVYQSLMAVFMYKYPGDGSFAPLLRRWQIAGLLLPEEVAAVGV